MYNKRIRPASQNVSDYLHSSEYDVTDVLPTGVGNVFIELLFLECRFERYNWKIYRGMPTFISSHMLQAIRWLWGCAVPCMGLLLWSSCECAYRRHCVLILLKLVLFFLQTTFVLHILVWQHGSGFTLMHFAPKWFIAVFFTFHTWINSSPPIVPHICVS